MFHSVQNSAWDVISTRKSKNHFMRPKRWSCKTGFKKFRRSQCKETRSKEPRRLENNSPVNVLKFNPGPKFEVPELNLDSDIYQEDTPVSRFSGKSTVGKNSIIIIPTKKTSICNISSAFKDCKDEENISEDSSLEDGVEEDVGPCYEESLDPTHGISPDPSRFEKIGHMVQSTAGNITCRTVDLLLQDVRSLALSSSSRANSSDSRSASTSLHTSTSKNISSFQETSSKRSRRLKNTSEEGDIYSDDEEGDHGRKKRRGGDFRDESASRRLKCPYYQRQPEKEMKGSCKGPGFTDIAKLKDHLKRVHSRPRECPRCLDQMESKDAYDIHLRQKPICDVLERPADDYRMDVAKWKELNLNRAPFSNAKDAGEKWTMLFRHIFPDDEEVPSPYDDNSISARFERLLAQTLETELLTRLGPALGNAIAGIRQDLPSIIRSCKDQAANKSSLVDSTLAQAPGEKRPNVSSSTASPKISLQAFPGPSTMAMPHTVDFARHHLEREPDMVNQANLCFAADPWSAYSMSTSAAPASSSKGNVAHTLGERIKSSETLDELTAMISESQLMSDTMDTCVTREGPTLIECASIVRDTNGLEERFSFELTEFDLSSFINE